jgi:putative membrane protein
MDDAVTKSTRDQLAVDFLKELSLVKVASVILVISAAGFLFLVWLLYYKGGTDYTSGLIKNLPALSAFFNAASTVLLLFGYHAIRRRNFKRHMKFNLTAFFTSVLFLISYIIYHSFAGDIYFTGQGAVRYVYFTILISHIILSAVVVPLILTSFYLAFSGKFKIHRKVSKFTLPIWLYVSVTGVVVFFMLYTYVGLG